MNLDNILKSAEVNKEKKNSKIPVVRPSEDIAEKVDRIRDLKSNIDSSKSILDLLFEEVLEYAEKQREELMKNNGFITSLRLVGKSGNNIAITWKDAYSKIPYDRMKDLVEVFNDKFENFFTKRITIRVKESSLTEEKIMELINLIGENRFAEFFEVERWIEPTKKYTLEQHLLSMQEINKAKDIVKPYKPTLSTK